MGKAVPSRAPSAPPIMNIGASTPPDLPEPKESDQITVLTTKIPRTRPRLARPVRRLSITPYPTPSARGSTRPPSPMTTHRSPATTSSAEGGG